MQPPFRFPATRPLAELRRANEQMRGGARTQDTMLFKRLNLSSATTPENFQKSVEAEIEKKQGRRADDVGGLAVSRVASSSIVSDWPRSKCRVAMAQAQPWSGAARAPGAAAHAANTQQRQSAKTAAAQE